MTLHWTPLNKQKTTTTTTATTKQIQMVSANFSETIRGFEFSFLTGAIGEAFFFFATIKIWDAIFGTTNAGTMAASRRYTG